MNIRKIALGVIAIANTMAIAGIATDYVNDGNFEYTIDADASYEIESDSISQISAYFISEEMPEIDEVVADNGNIYLSDIPYINELTYSTSSSILLDTNTSSQEFSLIVNGERKVFMKGVSAWATSDVVYDISKYSSEYQYISTYIGVDYTQRNTYYNNGATITVYTSEDGMDWELQEISGLVGITAYDESVYVKIPISEVNFIKFTADKIGSNWWSHWYDEVIYADLKLVKEDYENSVSPYENYKTVAEYDELLKAMSEDDSNYEHM